MLIPKLSAVFIYTCNGKYSRKDIGRYISKIDTTPGFGKDGECWRWMGPLRPHGRGQFRLNISIGINMSVRPARVSYETSHGIILTSEQYVCHKCDIRSCVNYNHLFLGTHQDNMDDMVSKGRQLSGDKNGNAKFTRDEIIHMRNSYKLFGHKNIKKFAYLIGQPYPTVYEIITNKSYKYDI